MAFHRRNKYAYTVVDVKLMLCILVNREVDVSSGRYCCGIKLQYAVGVDAKYRTHVLAMSL